MNEAVGEVVTKQVGRISGIIEKRRMLFPNIPGDKLDQSNKHEALQGYRPPVLQNLFKIYDYASPLETAQLGPQPARHIFRLRREFIAELVIAMDTKRKRTVFNKLDASVRKQFSALRQARQ